ncbi:23300_t:CDS:2, partial [Gigaspora margarita]
GTTSYKSEERLFTNMLYKPHERKNNSDILKEFAKSKFSPDNIEDNSTEFKSSFNDVENNCISECIKSISQISQKFLDFVIPSNSKYNKEKNKEFTRSKFSLGDMKINGDNFIKSISSINQTISDFANDMKIDDDKFIKNISQKVSNLVNDMKIERHNFINKSISSIGQEILNLVNKVKIDEIDDDFINKSISSIRNLVKNMKNDANNLISKINQQFSNFSFF